MKNTLNNEAGSLAVEYSIGAILYVLVMVSLFFRYEIGRLIRKISGLISYIMSPEYSFIRWVVITAGISFIAFKIAIHRIRRVEGE